MSGASIDGSVFLSISKADARFGWTRRAEQALILAREADAKALAGYAKARSDAEAAVTPRKVEWDRPDSDLEQENLRLRTRIADLESILSALRRIRENDINRAEEEGQSGSTR